MLTAQQCLVHYVPPQVYVRVIWLEEFEELGLIWHKSATGFVKTENI